MNRPALRAALVLAVVLNLSLSVTSALAQQRAALTDEEEDKLREEQDPGLRIELYVSFAQERLNLFSSFREKPDDPQYNTGKYLDRLLGQYIALDEEMKDWIQDQFDRGGDMRKGLKTILAQGPRQLEQLKHLQEQSDPRASAYGQSLQDAIDDLTDTLDGATQALTSQVKKLGELKEDEKVEQQEVKDRAKQEKKKEKEERKLQKRERKKGVPEDKDEN